MKIQKIQINPYTLPLTTGQLRSGLLIGITDEKEATGWGEIAPLPKWSTETLEEATTQLNEQLKTLTHIEWTPENCLQVLAQLKLLPSVTFGLESALLSLLDPLPEHSVPRSALLMGTAEEILAHAQLRHKEGYTSAKLKVSGLELEEAFNLIHELKEHFHLRIDVNRAWNTVDSLHFFAQFPLDAFDYVEEPFQNPHDLVQFRHPLAIDESFPRDLSLVQLEQLPTLKALVYKPTIQGGMLGCLPLHEWTMRRGISLVLSSSFESALGLDQIASLAHRLSLASPIGIGTSHFMKGCN